MSRSARLPVLEGIASAIIAVACFAFQTWLPSTHVAEADYRAAANAVARQAQPGDVILLYPWWTERARLFMPAGLPVVGFIGSDSLDLPRAKRIWVLAEPDLPRADWTTFTKTFGSARTEIGTSARFGRLALHLYANGRAKPVAFDGDGVIGASRVYLEGRDGLRSDCVWDGARHRCANNHSVRPQWREVAYGPQRCLTYDAFGPEVRIVVELPTGYIARAKEVQVSAAFIAETAFRTGPEATSVAFGIDVGDEHRTAQLIPGTHGFQTVALPVGDPASPVRVWFVSAKDNDDRVCVQIDGWAASK